ncbi:MAG: DNA-primase RepB domain-containing protein, partial [Spirochaetales bacterium]|nr:DNA-primase RepB domain-containing protein [Spirochaetales bacterium]
MTTKKKSLVPAKKQATQNSKKSPTYTISELAINQLKGHISQLCKHARDCDLDGKLIISVFGENPDTGKALPPVVKHFSPNKQQDIIEFILQKTTRLHSNVYMPPVLMRPDLAQGKKGGEKDIVAVLGLVADFDDDDAKNWKERIPIEPSYVLETSPDRFQVGFLLQEPMEPEEAKLLAQALKIYCHCDHGTADTSHVWRTPGTLNWPNKKKADAGRLLDPWEVKLVEGKMNTV